MNQKRTFSENLKGAWGQIAKKEKILLCMQSVLSIAIIVLVVLSMAGILPVHIINVVDLFLLAALFIVNAIRSFPKRKKSMVVYLVCAVFILVMLRLILFRL